MQMYITGKNIRCLTYRSSVCWHVCYRSAVSSRNITFGLRNVSFFVSGVPEVDGLGMWRVWVRRGECIGSWWGNRNDWGDLGVDGWIILGWISGRWDVGIWTGLDWPRIGTGGGRL